MENYFAKNLKYIRQKKNIERKKMANDLNIAQSTLSCWESGIRMPDLEMVARIANYLKIDDNFITKDLTTENDDNRFNKRQLLFDKTKDLLSDDDWATMEFIMNKTIANYEKNKNNIE